MLRIAMGGMPEETDLFQFLTADIDSEDDSFSEMPPLEDLSHFNTRAIRASVPPSSTASAASRRSTDSDEDSVKTQAITVNTKYYSDASEDSVESEDSQRSSAVWTHTLPRGERFDVLIVHDFVCRKVLAQTIRMEAAGAAQKTRTDPRVPRRETSISMRRSA